jgi:hypothetical protein
VPAQLAADEVVAEDLVQVAEAYFLAQGLAGGAERELAAVGEVVG